MSGGSIGINSTYPVDNRILSTLFGESSTSNSTLKNKTITVKTQYVPVQGQNTFGEVYELTVYVKSGDGDFELIAKTDYITARKNKDYATFPSTQAGYTNAMALVLGAYGVSTVTSASVANVEANGSSHQVKNVINYGQNQIDGDSADERISAAGIVYIDNFVAWAGTEELVEGTVFYNAD